MKTVIRPVTWRQSERLPQRGPFHLSAIGSKKSGMSGMEFARAVDSGRGMGCPPLATVPHESGEGLGAWGRGVGGDGVGASVLAPFPAPKRRRRPPRSIGNRTWGKLRLPVPAKEGQGEHRHDRPRLPSKPRRQRQPPLPVWSEYRGPRRGTGASTAAPAAQPHPPRPYTAHPSTTPLPCNFDGPAAPHIKASAK